MSADDEEDDREHGSEGTSSSESDDHTDDDDDDDDWDDFDASEDAMPTRVIEGLYIGSWLTEHQNVGALQKANVTHVLQVGTGFQPSHPTLFRYELIEIEDSSKEDIVQHFSRCFRFIDEACDSGGGCLVHCLAGVSRSAAVCIGYLMWKQKCDYEAAYKLTKDARYCVEPNAGFTLQLQQFEKLQCDLARWRGWHASDAAAANKFDSIAQQL